MDRTQLNDYIRRQLADFPCKSALLMADAETGEVLHEVNGHTRVVSASTVKVAVLYTALELCRQGKLTLDQLVAIPESEICDDTEVFEPGNRCDAGYRLWELLYWMIVESDNTATNAVITLLGYDAVNAWCAAHHLPDTILQRKMLDWDAIAAGRNNYTSPADQCRLYLLLYKKEILNDELRAVALDFLCRQRCLDGLLRYIPDPITLACKGGGLDYLNHDAGLFLLPDRPYFLGVFTWDGPCLEGDSRQKQLIGRISKAVYDTYGRRA